MVDELTMNQAPEVRVHGGQDLGQRLDLRDPQTASRQGFGHLQTDVTSPDHHHALWCALLNGLHDGERVAHRMQQMDPVLRAEHRRTPEPSPPVNPSIGGRALTAPVPITKES